MNKTPMFPILTTGPAAPEGQQEPMPRNVIWFGFDENTGEFTGEYCSVKPADARGMRPYIPYTAHPTERTVTEAEIQRLTTEIARKHGCDRGTFTVCWGKVEKGLPCRCEDEARHALTAALGAQPPPEGAVTEAMVARASAEYQEIFGRYLLSSHARRILKAAMEAGR